MCEQESIGGEAVVTASILRGIEALPIQVEAEVSAGLPGFALSGRPDASVAESRERVKAAISASGFAFPSGRRVAVNLSPASLRKSGTGLDLPIAVAILCASGQVDPALAEGAMFVGELTCTGDVLPTAGMLAHALAAEKAGLKLVGADSEDRYYGGGRLVLDSLSDLPCAKRPSERTARTPARSLDYSDLAGHETAKALLEVAAAGGHGVLLQGPPGSCAGALARRLPSILPPPTREEALETAAAHSAGGLDPSAALGGSRPFRAPSRSACAADLAGSGSPVVPGEGTLAHNGVLFLEDVNGFAPEALGAVRAMRKSGRSTIRSCRGGIDMPARFMLAASASPCPCGFHGDPGEPCTDSPQTLKAYRESLSRAVEGLVDMRIRLPRARADDLLRPGGKGSREMRDSVMRAREFAEWRRSGEGGPGKEAADVPELLRDCRVEEGVLGELDALLQGRPMPERSLASVLRISRTLADMEKRERVGCDHLRAAVGLALLD